MYILKPPAAGILYTPPLLYTPHAYKGLFRGGGVFEIWPAIPSQGTFSQTRQIYSNVWHISFLKRSSQSAVVGVSSLLP